MGANDGRDLMGTPYPGADTRQWGSWGTVDTDPSDATKASIRFFQEDGTTPLPDGYLVDVTLQPSGVNVQARVVGPIAGLGESNFEPFNPGDLVYVMVPEGDERAGCAIVGRANNELDAFPTVVSGFDVTQNNFGFTRLRYPRVIETASGYLIRSSVTGAHIGIDQSGGVTLGAGDGGYLHLGPDFLGIQTQDSAGSIQVVPGSGTTGNSVQANADACSLTLDQDQCLWLTPGTIAIGSSGLPPMGHALTVEQLCGILATLVVLPASAFTTASAAAVTAAVPNDGGHAAFTAFGAALAASILLEGSLISTALAAAALAPLDPTIATAITAALQVPPDPLVSQKFGVGCAGLTLG